MDAFFDISGWAALLVLMPATWMQVWKNWQRKSTDGVRAPWVLPRCFYNTSILITQANGEENNNECANR